MATKVAGIDLEALPVREALSAYQEMSGLGFDLDQATRYKLTPEKGNTARSESLVRLGEEVVGKLFVIAFKPQDGTGDESTFKLKDLVVPAGLPHDPKIVPREKSDPAKPASERNHHETALSIVRHRIDDVHADPEMYGGAFDLLGLDGHLIRKIGELGHDSSVDASDLTPLTTLTVGFHTGADGKSERFGNPHSVYSPVAESLQVVGFIGVMDDVYQRHGDVLRHLNPQEPRGLIVP